MLDEKHIVREVLSGSKKAFVQLVRQYEGLVLHIATPLVGVNEDREDICQDVFIKVFDKLETFQFRSKLGTWIGNITYNTCINFLQKKRPVTLSGLMSTEQEAGFLDMAAVEQADPEKIFIKSEDGRRMNKAIEGLPVLQRTVILLFYVDEMSLEEVAVIMEMPVNTVKSHLFRARASLKKYFDQTKGHEK